MTHPAEASIRGIYVPVHDSETPRRDSFAQQIILSKERVFVEAPQLVEFAFVEQHEHASGKWLHPRACVLKEVVSAVEEVVAPVPVRAPDVRGQTMQFAPAHLFQGPPQERSVMQHNIRIDKQYIWRNSQASSRVAAG